MNAKRLETRKHLHEGVIFLRLVDENLKKVCEYLGVEDSDFTNDDKDYFFDISDAITNIKESLEIELYGAHTGQIINPESFVEQYQAMLKWWSEEDE